LARLLLGALWRFQRRQGRSFWYRFRRTDPDGYKNYVNEREAAFRAELAKQRGAAQ
jgi:hypothetical protein